MVDYWPTNISENPRCPHGPTLLFSRKQNGKKFFACSAFRDRKKCPFFQWYDNPKPLSHDFKILSNVDEFSSAKYDNNCARLETSVQIIYCFTCDISITEVHINEHSNHNLSVKNKNKFSSNPTNIIKTKEESKGESQYHFCDSTLNTLVSFFQQLQIFSILNIGCPRLHEHLLNNHRNMKSMLLDIDDRYAHFYNSSQFQLFNMFNCHFFDSKGSNFVESFIKSSSQLAIIIDPPFGGRIEALEYTFKQLISLQKNDYKEEAILILLIMPYFMESAVQKSFSTMYMLDYKVEYRNHRRFKKRDCMSDTKGSAVRIFTNYSPSRFILPAEEGYKYCVVCDRWVFQENKHCYKCGACTSKNGGRYKHCNDCNKCVKITWKHCKKCRICKLPDHSCSLKQMSLDQEVVHDSQKNSKKNKHRNWKQFKAEMKKKKRKVPRQK